MGRASSRGQRIRFWATPDDEAFYDELVKLDVPLINTDDYARLQTWLTS